MGFPTGHLLLHCRLVGSVQPRRDVGFREILLYGLGLVDFAQTCSPPPCFYNPSLLLLAFYIHVSAVYELDLQRQLSSSTSFNFISPAL